VDFPWIVIINNNPIKIMTLTPEQFNKLVTKEEHKELEKKFDKMSDKVDRILGVAEGIATEQKTIRQELVMNQSAHRRFDKRITTLEAAPA